MLQTAIKIARETGGLLREQFGKAQSVKQASQYDIKLQMDLDCQRLIERKILGSFPDHSIIGEEESHGNPDSEYRWVVDPLDGTVNYTYGIPHFAVSIGLQKRSSGAGNAEILGGYQGILGVVFDPMRDEMYTAEYGKGAFLNGKPLRVSDRARLEEAILSLGFAKTQESIEQGIQNYETLVRRARKLRALGSAALDLAYIAAGRFEAYLEFKISLWDIAAGILLVEEAGGKVQIKKAGTTGLSFEILASNGKVDFRDVVRWE